MAISTDRGHPLTEAVAASLSACLADGRTFIAFSGGADSTALLLAARDLFADSPDKLIAVHVNHALHPQADEWQAHCQTICERLGVTLLCRRAEIDPQSSDGPEGAARDARLRIFEQVIGRNDTLMTAHHRDDQIETLLLNLIRGSGVHGLAGIPRSRPIGAGWLLRPLLDHGRAELVQRVRDAGLDWIEDPANQSPEPARNILRHQVVPLLRQHWTGIEGTIARSAGILRTQATLLDQLVRRELVVIQQADRACLDLTGLLRMPLPLQNEVLRLWLKDLDLPLPNHRRLIELIRQCRDAGPDATVSVCWPGAEVRRYRKTLYAMAPQPPLPASPLSFHGSQLQLPGNLGRLQWVRPNGQPTDAPLDQISVRFRQGGERIRLAGEQHSRSLKSLFQQAGIPPWERSRLPLLYRRDSLLGVAEMWFGDALDAAMQQQGCRLLWERG